MKTRHSTDGGAVMTTRAPRWAVWAAYAVPLCLLPSSIWRAQLVIEKGLEEGWYLLALSLLEMGLGLLTLGLVHSWGEVVPRWVPALGGRRIPIGAAVVPAACGTLAVTVLTAVMLFNRLFNLLGGKPETVEEARALSVVEVPANAELGGVEPWIAWLYAPSLAWGPLLGLVTFAYYRRRTNANVSASVKPEPELTRD
ncbi:hypothetical protein [Amycolatopsis cihanbeyliensis]|uniref:Uncharacterized protein n=1 Tax=Amycolatopsis cihanbeyliensis TaxID=1128664 RepID=A0A542DE55_AMYCI|nr:hypothetical protein [Amycolatopsis cihanbeyliensis]TQJ01358.1 hypothetical protein FB471_1036 [Amycolatopsis cihanbeyliensis]